MSTSLLQWQALLELITTFANEEHIIHPQKSVIIPYNISSKSQLEFVKMHPVFESKRNPVPVTDEFTHLSIQRNISSSLVTVGQNKHSQENILCMMGSGLHGLNGLPVKTSLLLYNTYVIPRLLYGLETIKLNDTALTKLSSLHNYTLRCILKPSSNSPDFGNDGPQCKKSWWSVDTYLTASVLIWNKRG